MTATAAGEGVSPKTPMNSAIGPFEGKVVSTRSFNCPGIPLSKQIEQVAITGAASGMGLATATLLASRGAIVSLADLNEETIKSAAKSLPGSHRHIYTVVDVRSRKSVDSWIEQTLQKLGKLDGAVNMAGIIRPAKPITESTEDDWDSTFAVNARGVFNCLGAELKAISPGGSIVSRLPVWSRESATDMRRSVLTCCCFL